VLSLATQTSQASWTAVHFRSTDGLTLFARDYNRDALGLPIICLSGLTRNSKEFHFLARHLSGKHRLIAPDYRGRGQSEYAKDWQTYQPPVEMADVVTLMDHLSIAKALFIGTSRGGLITMLMAATSRDRIAGAILNDVGPVVEQKGLARIAGYVGQQGPLNDWQEATQALRAIYPGFDLDDDEWLEFARMIFRENEGKPALDYDPALANTLPGAQQIQDTPLPDLWQPFQCLDGLPVAAIRGENSDILSPQTLADMAMRLHGLEAVTVPGRGHTPFLTEPEALETINRVLHRLHAA
jgi:pimeloyl-ACP methyl ester carboxylesterase